jgi:hypothetical protein
VYLNQNNQNALVNSSGNMTFIGLGDTPKPIKNGALRNSYSCKIVDLRENTEVEHRSQA